MIDRMDASDELSGLPNQDPEDDAWWDSVWGEKEHPVMMSWICFPCIHLAYNVARQCAAFEYIPDDIWHARNDHRKPYPGDHGIQFAPRKEKASEE